MEIKKTAQQALFKELSRFELKANDPPEYNGYSIDVFGAYMQLLDGLSEGFEKEMSDNLTTLSPSMEVYMTDLMKSILKIELAILTQKREEIHDTLRENPDAFKRNRLGYVDYFIKYQLGIIRKTAEGISQKLEIIKNPELFKATVDSPLPQVEAVEEAPVLKIKIKSGLAKVELTVLLWLLAEAKYFEFDKNEVFVKFIENNFQFSRREGQYDDVKDIGPLMSKLRTDTETDRHEIKKRLLEGLSKIVLPNESEASVLQIRKYSTKEEQSESVKKVREALNLDNPKA